MLDSAGRKSLINDTSVADSRDEAPVPEVLMLLVRGREQKRSVNRSERRMGVG